MDKYEGDAIIAFFNAPLDVPGHQAAALSAALGIQRASAEVSRAWEARLGSAVATRVGIATGPAVVGNMGSEGRFDYTAIGDTINLASRLEGTNKFYGTRVMASEETVAGAGKGFVARPVDRVRVKGKTKPILLYEVMGAEDEMERERMEGLVAPYLKAYRHFEERRTVEAQAILAKVLARYPEDAASQGLIARCERAEREPAWDLVTDLQAK